MATVSVLWLRMARCFKFTHFSNDEKQNFTHETLIFFFFLVQIHEIHLQEKTLCFFFVNLGITFLEIESKSRRSHKVPKSFESLLHGENIFLKTIFGLLYPV